MTLPKRSSGFTTTTTSTAHSRNGSARAKHASGLNPRMRPRMGMKRAISRRLLSRSCPLPTDCEMPSNRPSRSFLRLRHPNELLHPQGLSGGPGPVGYSLPSRSDLA
jgi:hypothetical protein